VVGEEVPLAVEVTSSTITFASIEAGLLIHFLALGLLDHAINLGIRLARNPLIFWILHRREFGDQGFTSTTPSSS
jgi:hypothetical protein